MSNWREMLFTLLSADERAVKKVDQLDERQRQLGHDINNLRMKLDPLYKMVEMLEEDSRPLGDRGQKRHGS